MVEERERVTLRVRVRVTVPEVLRVGLRVTEGETEMLGLRDAETEGQEEEEEEGEGEAEELGFIGVAEAGASLGEVLGQEDRDGDRVSEVVVVRVTDLDTVPLRERLGEPELVLLGIIVTTLTVGLTETLALGDTLPEVESLTTCTRRAPPAARRGPTLKPPSFIKDRSLGAFAAIGLPFT